MKKLKILNLYAGIGGNAHNWDRADHDITHVEINEEIAEELERLHPEDNIVVGDAHEYLKENYEEFDFIWSSPPCQTHSQMHLLSAKDDSPQNAERTPNYPDMKLWQEIIFLKNFFNGDWVVENVDPYYETPFDFQRCGRHLVWSNFSVPDVKIDKHFDFKDGKQSTREQLEEWLGIELENNIYLGGSHDPGQVLRNAVHPEIGKQILKSRNKKQATLNSL